jgi:hypothetical protein
MQNVGKTGQGLKDMVLRKKFVLYIEPRFFTSSFFFLMVRMMSRSM